jgi:hypothetical protein
MAPDKFLANPALALLQLGCKPEKPASTDLIGLNGSYLRWQTSKDGNERQGAGTFV